MTQKSFAVKPDGTLTKKPGWFSWRHQSNDAHLAANVGHDRATTKARKRAEAEARNASHGVRLACGHTTTLDPDTHARRCGAIA